MSNEVAAGLAVCLAGGLLAALIAYSRTRMPGSMVGFFIIGAVLPIIGIILACLAKPQPGPPQPPGWYADPWGQARWRWYDGYQWTWQTG